MKQIECDMTKLIFQQGMKDHIEQKRMKFSTDFTDEFNNNDSSKQQRKINKSLSSNDDLNLFLFGGKNQNKKHSVNTNEGLSIRQEIESTYI